MLGFVALGIWQLQRREWKHALVAAVEARIHAVPVAAPGPATWGEGEPYTRLFADGRFLTGRDVRVKALTDRGAGFWVMTPLDTGGFVLLVNRGFVAQGAAVAGPPDGRVRVTGLLRASEPGGGFLRSNDPAGDRWYSRDVAAIARAQGLGVVAPYFIDADAGGGSGYPVGGMTVVRFSDNHLGYALTWFALAGLGLAALWRLVREPRAR